MEMLPLVSINYHLTVLKEEEEDALMVIRQWGIKWGKDKNRLLRECRDFKVKVSFYHQWSHLNHMCSAAIREMIQFRLSSSHYSPMANYNGSLGCCKAGI